jgi:hypothetical protein
MFCPNCGTRNGVEQNYCRGCGLKLDAIVEAVSDQFPSKEFADLQCWKERFQRMGLFCLSIAGLIGFSLMLFLAAQYKLVLLGPGALYGSAIMALIGFLLLSAFLFGYPKLFMKAKELPRDKDQSSVPDTAKLIDDRPFEPAPSVTEDTTDLLKVPAARQKN